MKNPSFKLVSLIALVAAIEGSTLAAEPPRQKWQNMVVLLCRNQGQSGDDYNQSINQSLARLGQSGFELISVNPFTNSQGTQKDGFVAALKRPIAN
jgi:hypothetical protein